MYKSILILIGICCLAYYGMAAHVFIIEKVVERDVRPECLIKQK